MLASSCWQVFFSFLLTGCKESEKRRLDRKHEKEPIAHLRHNIYNRYKGQHIYDIIYNRYRDANKKANTSRLAEGSNGQEFSPSTLIVLCDGERGKKQVLKAAKKYGCEVIYDYKIINGYAFRIPKDKSLEETEQYLKGVTGVNRDQIMHLDGAGSSLQ